MSTRCLLHLEPHRVSAYSWRNGVLQAEAAFANDAAGHQGFAEYAAVHRKSGFSILADLEEESQTEATIPRLRGRERQALIERRLHQQFPGNSLGMVVSLGYENAPRPNERLLLTTLNAAHVFDNWLHHLQAVKAPLIGIYTPSQLNGRLLALLAPALTNCLLLTLHPGALRESWVVNGNARLSRRLPLTENSPEAVSHLLAQETDRLHQYLLNQRQITPGETLRIIAIADAASKSEIGQLDTQKQREFEVISPSTVAEKVKIRDATAVSNCTVLYLHLLARKPPRTQFAPPAWRQALILARLRHALIATTLVILSGCTILGWRTQTRIEALNKATRQLDETEQRIKQSHPPANAAPESALSAHELQQIRQQYAELQRLTQQPGTAWQMISQALAHVPEARLEELDWKITPPEPSTAQGGSETVMLSGTLQTDRNRPESASASFEALLDALHHATSRNVQILRAPATPILRGISEREDAPQFALEIVRPLP